MHELSSQPSSRRRFILGLGASAMAMGLAGHKMGSELSAKTSRPAAGKLPGSLQMAHRTALALGCDISMIALHVDKNVAELALNDCFRELARVEKVMSIFNPDSQISRLNAKGFLKNPDPYLVRAIDESMAVAKQSDGAFDITVQPLWNLYAEAQKNSGLPSPEAVADAVKRVDWRGVSYSADEIRFRDKSMGITLNGIAQGFAADRAMEALKRHGIEHALVNAGEISSLGCKASGDPWVVGIQHPREKDAYNGLAGLDGRCLSTSGDYETVFSPDFRYNHIFDPSTGVSPPSFSSVTVVSPDATTADALSTAIFVLGPERGLALAQKYPGTDVLLVMKDQRMLATASFPWRSANEEKPKSISS
jgi:thiamine biosynthesis lipoprotein